MRTSLLVPIFVWFNLRYWVCGDSCSVSRQYICAVNLACINGGWGGALVCGHTCWCSGLSSAGMRRSRLALGYVVGASVRSSLLALTLVSVELRKCTVIPACVTVSHAWWYKSVLVNIGSNQGRAIRSNTGPWGNKGSDTLARYSRLSRCKFF